MDFALHPQLANDTAKITDFELASVLLMNDSNYPWIILVPRIAGLTEIDSLTSSQASLLFEEISKASNAIRDWTPIDKINVAALGNMVPQLHIHVVGRRRDDLAWPKPIWGAVPVAPYSTAKLESHLSRLQRIFQEQTQ